MLTVVWQSGGEVRTPWQPKIINAYNKEPITQQSQAQASPPPCQTKQEAWV